MHVSRGSLGGRCEIVWLQYREHGRGIGPRSNRVLTCLASCPARWARSTRWKQIQAELQETRPGRGSSSIRAHDSGDGRCWPRLRSHGIGQRRVCHAGREIPGRVAVDGPMSGSMAMAGSGASRLVACEDSEVACRTRCGKHDSPHRTF